jgi:hypothetical protein
MAKYTEIQRWVKKKYGFCPQTCWIAHVKELYNLKPRKASNRKLPDSRKNPCPTEKIEAIKEAFFYFKMI